ncbi:LysR family transcriptional regulator [Mycobacterium sp. NPDC050853]|uniref:LysR family transcriptional regulator n=1 Tax=Mycobacterium sp. NPDC050853 TaxID=3155160 RepID=UPI0034077559
MDLHQLECFLAVVEAGTFTGAARRVHLAQSGVSAHVKALERELGQPLFERRARSAVLTAAGQALLPHARAALDSLAAGRASVEGLTGLLHGHLAIGTITSISPRHIDLPRLLTTFHRQHPGVELSLIEDTSAVLARRVTEGELDVALVSLTDDSPAGVHARELTRDCIVAAFSPSHPLVRHGDTVSLAALAQYPLIALSPGSGIRTQLDKTLHASGITARISFEASDPDVLVALAAQGLGIAVVPESAMRQTKGVVHAQLPDVPPGRIGILWRKGKSVNPAAPVFVRHVVARVREMLT